jgi:hypothetical protein
MTNPRGRPQTFDRTTRMQLADLVRKHGVQEACRRSEVAVSRATLAKIAKEFNVPLQVGRRPLAALASVPLQFTAEQVERLRQALAQGAAAWGFKSDLWNVRRISDVVQKLLGVKCHAVQLKPLLLQFGFELVERSVVELRVAGPRSSDDGAKVRRDAA